MKYELFRNIYSEHERLLLFLDLLDTNSCRLLGTFLVIEYAMQIK